MSELDDAIREHLELKRRHGAREAELKDLEDEAFGTGERPLDPFKAGAEALTEGGEAGEKGSSASDEETKPPSDSVSEAETKLDETPADLSDLPELPDSSSADEPAADAPAAEEPAAVEDEASGAPPPPPPDSPIPPPPPRPDPGSEVVHQPTQEHPAPDPPSEELARAADEFEAEFGDTSSAKTDEPEPEEEPAGEPAGEAAGDDGPMLFDFEAESGSTSAGESPPLEAPAEPEPEGDFGEREPLPDPDDAFSDLGPAEPSTGGGELPFEDEDLPPEEALSHDAEGDEGGPGAVTADTSERDAIDPTEQYSLPDEEQATEFEEEAEDGPAEGVAPAEGGKDDLLEETPDFLEEKPEGDEDLWFEKKPPKDFDFEDEG